MEKIPNAESVFDDHEAPAGEAHGEAPQEKAADAPAHGTETGSTERAEVIKQDILNTSSDKKAGVGVAVGGGAIKPESAHPSAEKHGGGGGGKAGKFFGALAFLAGLFVIGVSEGISKMNEMFQKMAKGKLGGGSGGGGGSHGGASHAKAPKPAASPGGHKGGGHGGGHH